MVVVTTIRKVNDDLIMRAQEIAAFLNFRRLSRPLYILQRRPDPECFCAMTDAGLVCILTDFYGTSVLYLPNSSSCSLQVKPLPRGKGSGLYLRTPEDEERLYFYLLPGQEGPAGAFVRRWFSQPAEEG